MTPNFLSERFTMTKLAKLAGTLSFAHLLGVKAARAESSEDEDKDKKDKAKAEDDDEEAKARAADESDGDKKSDDDKQKDAKKAKAEGSDDDEAKAEDDDTDDEDGDDDEKKPSAAVKRDRARCARIIAHGIGMDAVRQACAYAFDTNMSAKVAIATLNATRADGKQGTSLHSRMSAQQQVAVRPEGVQQAQGSAGTAQAILAAANKARGQV